MTNERDFSALVGMTKSVLDVCACLSERVDELEEENEMLRSLATKLDDRLRKLEDAVMMVDV